MELVIEIKMLKLLYTTNLYFFKSWCKRKTDGDVCLILVEVNVSDQSTLGLAVVC